MNKLIIILFSSLFFPSCISIYMGDSFEENFTNDLVIDKTPTTTESIYEMAERCLNQLCSEEFAGRKAGTTGDSLAFCYLINEIESLGYKADIQKFKTEEGTLLRNIVVNTSSEKCDSIIVIGSHYDGPIAGANYPAANDNASGCVANLIVLRKLKEQSFPTNYGLLCCFWDSEEVFEGKAFRGSEHFAQTFSDPGLIKLYLNLDTIGHIHESLGVVRSNGALVDQLIECLPQDQPYKYVIRKPNDGSFSDFVSFRSIKVPYIGFHDHYGIICPNPNHSSLDCPSAISLEKLDWVSDIYLMLIDSIKTCLKGKNY